MVRAGVVRAVTAAVAVLALAAPATSAAGSPAAAPRAVEWRLLGCQGVVALVPTTQQALAPHLPAGFTAFVPPAVAATLPPDPRLRAVVGVEVFDCAEGSGLRGSVGPQQYASVFTFVQPPRALADTGFDLEFVKFDTLVPDAPRRKVLAAAGLPVQDGSVAVTVSTARRVGGAPAGAVAASWRTQAGGTHQILGAAAAPTTFAGSFVEFQRAKGGLAQWQSRFRSSAALGGTGVVQLAAGSLPARILGRTDADAYLLVPSAVDFRGRTLLPARR